MPRDAAGPDPNMTPPAPPPTPLPPDSSRRRGGLWDRLVGRFRDPAEGRGGALLHGFADEVEAARQPPQVEAALVRVAAALSGACRVELLRDGDPPDGPGPKPLAVWPAGAGGLTAAAAEALGYPLCLGLRCGDRYRLSLRLYDDRPGRWPPRVVRRLRTACALAAAAERGLNAARRARPDAPAGPETAEVRDATFLSAVLPYALAQAARHREPLTVFCVELDGLAALRQSRGAEAAGRAARRLAEAVASTLRGSDVVARLDDDRVVVVLPDTGPPHALTVAGVVREAAQGTGRPTGGSPALTASLGVACFPADGRDMIALLAAADDALHRAAALGPGGLATASPHPPADRSPRARRVAPPDRRAPAPPSRPLPVASAE